MRKLLLSLFIVLPSLIAAQTTLSPLEILNKGYELIETTPLEAVEVVTPEGERFVVQNLF